MGTNSRFSQIVSNFQGMTLPETVMALAGYCALITNYNLRVPLPDRLAVISAKHRRYESDLWTVFTLKHAPEETLAGHLTFALKNGGERIVAISSISTAYRSSTIAIARM